MIFGLKIWTTSPPGSFLRFPWKQSPLALKAKPSGVMGGHHASDGIDAFFRSGTAGGAVYLLQGQKRLNEFLGCAIAS